jgi:DNA-binding HxlR family transcriptional regulator
MKKQGKTEPLDPAAVCKSSDLMAVTELLTKIGDKWSTFSILSLDLLGGRSRFSELERAIPGIPQRMLTGDKSPKHSLINRGEYPSCSWVTAIRTLGGQLLKTGHFTR